MRNDPAYLSQVLTYEASLGVLSVDGNLYSLSITEDILKTNKKLYMHRVEK